MNKKLLNKSDSFIGTIVRLVENATKNAAIYLKSLTKGNKLFKYSWYVEEADNINCFIAMEKNDLTFKGKIH